MAEVPELSVVVPMFRVADRVLLFLAALEAQTLSRDSFECIFVDDGSDDATGEIVQRAASSLQYRLLRNPRNLGRSVSRNRGWKQARGRWVVFLDGDMLAHPDLLRMYLEAFRRGHADVLVGRRLHLDLRTSKGSHEWSLARKLRRTPRTLFKRAPHSDFEVLRSLSGLGIVPAAAQVELEEHFPQICDSYPHSLARALGFITANVAVSRDWLQATGGFCRFFPRGEDTDLGLRLARAGARFQALPSAEAVQVFTEWSNEKDSAEQVLHATVTRHPFISVILWYAWALQRDSVNDSQRLSLMQIAKAEAAGTLSGMDWLGLARRAGLALPLSAWTPRDELIRHYQLSRGMSGERVSEVLQRAERSGVVHCVREGRVLFDRRLLDNWIDQVTPHKHRARSGSTSQRSAHANRPMDGVSSAWFHARYQMCVADARRLHRSCDPIVNVPLPTVAARQERVEFGRWHPPEVVRYRQGDMLIGVPLALLVGASHSDSRVTLRYEFSCRLDQEGHVDPGAELPAAVVRWLRPSYQQAETRELLRVLDEIGLREPLSNRARAHAIAQWMYDNFRVGWSSGLDSASISSGIGDGVQVNRVYVNLCRQAGIPAREVFGCAFVGARIGDNVSCTGSDSPLAGAWTEVYCPGQGWLSVEIIRRPYWRGDGDGKLHEMVGDDVCRLASPSVVDRFGSLSRFRVYSTRYASDVPTLAQRFGPGWRALTAELAVSHSLNGRFAERPQP